jgi:hypothetical protein
MADSTLAVTKTELDVLIGFHLGYGRTSDNWSTSQQSDIDDARDFAVSRIYAEHDWSFMSPVTTIDTTADDDEQDLPDDFGYIREGFFFESDLGYAPPRQVSPGMIYDRLSMSSASGVMEYFAIETKTQTGAAGTRWQVLWSPPPDDAYTMTYRYKVDRNALSDTYPYPAGGAMFRNCLIECCYAAADLQFRQEVGVHEQMYAKLLEQCKRNDAMNKSPNLGLNLDRSGDLGWEQLPRRYCTYMGSVGT